MRWFVTLMCSIAAIGLGFVPVPGVTIDEAMSSDEALGPMLNLGMLGIGPLLSGAVLVELFAVVHPGWRMRRDAGRDARAPLRRAALAVGLLLAALQAYFLWGWLRSPWLFGVGLVDDGPAIALRFGVSLLGATVCYAILADAITRRGIVHGYSLLIALQALGPVLIGLRYASVESTDDGAVPWLWCAALCIGLAFLTARLLRRRPSHEAGAPLVHVQTPSSGLEPLSGAALVLHVIGVGGYFLGPELLVDSPPGPGLMSPHYWDVFVPTVVVLTWAWTWVFYRPDALVRCWSAHERARTGVEPSAIGLSKAVISERWRALRWTVPFVLAIACVDAYFSDRLPGVSAIAIVVLTAIVHDVLGALRFRRQHGEVVAVDEVHRLYLLPIIAEDLRRAGIPMHAASLGHRTLLQFFGPFVPVEIRVPEARAEAARGIVGNVIGARSR